MNEVKINETDYKIDFNSLSYIKHRQMFNRGIFDDIKLVENFVAKQVVIEQEIVKENPDITEEAMSKMLSRVMLDGISEFIEAITRLAYTGIVCADDNFKLGYEQWLKTIKRVNTNDDWIVEVTELAVSSFC